MNSTEWVEQCAQASVFLKNLDADWGRLVSTVGACTHKLRVESPYAALVRSVVYQQLTGRASDAILGRLQACFGGDLPKPAELLGMNDVQLRGCGFSARKTSTLKGIASAALQDVVPSRAQAEMLSDAELIEQLICLPGIGRWTVEMVLIFTLGRLDVLPVGDLGVREGYRRLKALAEPPKPRALATIGQDWMPYRTVAAWYLWQVPRAWG